MVSHASRRGPPAVPATEGPQGRFPGGGVTADLINSIDWSATALGPMSGWPDSLHTLVGTMLRSRHPMFLFWGPELIQFYNDAYLPSFGVGKHPRAMGQRGEECWGEVWPIIWPQIDDAMARGKASWNEDALVPIFRNGRIEEVFWTYGYSPACDGGGRVAGTLVVCTETTARVVGQRRLEFVRRLAEVTAAWDDVESVAHQAIKVVAAVPHDIPFALLYRADPAGDAPALVAHVHVSPEDLPALDEAARGLLRGRGNVVPPPLEAMALPPGIPSAGGPWPEPPSSVFVATARTAGIGTFVFGVSSRLPFDRYYAEFLTDVVDQVDASAARLEAFRARAAMEAERRNLVLQAPVPMALMTGPTHVFELVKHDFFAMIGGREIAGKSFVDAFPELARTPLPGILGGAYRTGEIFSAEEYPIRLDLGNDGVLVDRFFKFSLAPVRDAAGGVYGLVVVAVDVTDQVAARQQLERANAERQKLVEELEAASRAKDAFLATVSHELRTPLSAILGWARLLRAGKVPPEKVDRALDAVERNSLAQVALIGDLLDVSRIVSGKLRLDVQGVELFPLVESAVDSVQHALDAKGLRFEQIVDPSAGSILGDPHRIRQVLWNLLSNAAKFTPKGGSVKLAVERGDSSVVLTVSDTGQGIPAHLLPTIFERFKQADGSAARVHGGLGLGLAITRHIVELHGGTVEAESGGEGRGSTFVVRLPVAPPRVERRGPFRQPGASSPPGRFEPPQELQGLTVLIVDDEADTRELLSEVLHQLGTSVLAASSAEEALTLLDRASPRVVVCDIGMPGMDGYGFIEAVRQRTPASGGRVVALALTAFASPDDRRRALRAGFQMHLAKPVEPAEFVAAVANLAQLAVATA